MSNESVWFVLALAGVFFGGLLVGWWLCGRSSEKWKEKAWALAGRIALVRAKNGADALEAGAKVLYVESVGDEKEIADAVNAAQKSVAAMRILAGLKRRCAQLGLWKNEWE